MQDTIANPFLDEDTEEEALYAQLDQKASSVQDSEKNKPWYRERTEEELKAIEAMIAAGITPPGRKKKKTVHSRRDITENDLWILYLLLKFKYLTKKQICFWMQRAGTTINNRLKGLQELGLVDSIEPGLTNMLWYAKKAAVRTLEDSGWELPEEYVLIREDKLGVQQLCHTLAVNQVALHYASPNGILDPVNGLSLKILLTETQLLKQFGRARVRDGFTQSMSATGELAKTKARIALRDGTLKVQDLFTEFPELRVLTAPKATGMKTAEWSSPDLVICNESNRNSGAPVSFAVEVELTKKQDAGAYERIMELYKRDKIAYKAVIWVVKDESIEKAIVKACEKIGFPRDRVFITRLLTNEGKPYKNGRSL